MSDTPRTNEAIANLCDRGDDRFGGMVEHAYKLERELAALLALLDGMAFRDTAAMIAKGPEFCRAAGEEWKRLTIAALLGTHPAANPLPVKVHGQEPK